MRGCTGVDTSDSKVAETVRRVDCRLSRLCVTLALSAVTVTVAAAVAYGFQTFGTPV
ncbi:hypothetical protein [Halorubrum tibetense]|uniref:Uncharacterized protein n=1 Tax=Halorubrum tibetense TaxID=175631 RepID=A0ABD5S9M8_9EURY